MPVMFAVGDAGGPAGSDKLAGSGCGEDGRVDIGARVVGAVLDLLVPPVCPGCGTEGELLCPACRRALEARASAPAGVAIGLAATVPPPLLQLEWCAAYVGPVRAALHALKYGGETRLAVPLGAAVARRWARAGAGGDLLVPVPIHPARRRERGYDQAELLAAAAADRLGLPVVTALERRRATVAQFELGRGERARNVAGAFGVVEPAAIAGRWVVLVDDVVTTGATLVACAEALLQAGAAAVSAVAVARER